MVTVWFSTVERNAIAVCVPWSRFSEMLGAGIKTVTGGYRVSAGGVVGSDDYLMVLDPWSLAVTEWPRFLGYRFSERPP